MSRRRKSTRKNQVVNTKKVIVEEGIVENVQEYSFEVNVTENKSKERESDNVIKKNKNNQSEIDIEERFKNATKTIRNFSQFGLLVLAVTIFSFLIVDFTFFDYLQMSIDSWMFVVLIFFYYGVIFILNRNVENILESCFLNFLKTILFYNILMYFNIFDIPMLSITYVVPNILYFYIAFLIATFSYKIYDFISFIGELILSLINGATKNILILLALVIVPYISIGLLFNWISVFSQNLNISKYYDIFFGWFVIFIILSGIFFKLNKGLLKKIYFKIVSYEIKYKIKENVDKKTDFILNFFRMSKIPDLKLVDKENNILIIKSIFYIFIKIVVPVWLIMFYLAGFQYMYYGKKNDGYCTNISAETALVRLYNGNVIVFNKDLLKEVNCEKKKIITEVNFMKHADNMIEK